MSESRHIDFKVVLGFYFFNFLKKFFPHAVFEAILQARASNLTFPNTKDSKITVYRHNNNNNSTQLHSLGAKNQHSVPTSERLLLSGLFH